MSIDIFGRQLAGAKVQSSGGRQGPPGIGFKVTTDNQYDIDNKRLCNIADPQDPNDAVSVRVVKNILDQAIIALETATRQAFENSMQLALAALESKIDSHVSQEQFVKAVVDEELARVFPKIAAGVEKKRKRLEKSSAPQNLQQQQYEEGDSQRTS